MTSKTSNNNSKIPKLCFFSDALRCFRMHASHSKCVRTYPGRSERIRMDPNTSENFEIPARTLKNQAKTSEIPQFSYKNFIHSAVSFPFPYKHERLLNTKAFRTRMLCEHERPIEEDTLWKAMYTGLICN